MNITETKKVYVIYKDYGFGEKSIPLKVFDTLEKATSFIKEFEGKFVDGYVMVDNNIEIREMILE